MNIEQITWVAGLLEGEGSFGYRTSHSVRISCGMTDKDVLERLQEYTGVGSIIAQGTKQKEHHKDVWVWYIDGPRAINLMKEIYPYMLSRRQEKIDSVFELVAQRKADVLEKKNAREKIGFNAAKEYIAGGKSYRELQKKYGISFVTIRNYVEKLKNNSV